MFSAKGSKNLAEKKNKWEEKDPITFNLQADTKTSFLTTSAGEIMAACEESQFAGKVLNPGSGKAKASVEVAKEGLT